MMTNQELQLASVREVTGTAYGWPGDWHALFDLAGIPQGDFNGRLLAWINDYLGTSYAGLPQAMQAFAVDQGYINWSSMGTFDASGASGSVVYDFSAASLPAGATLERASTGTRFNASGVMVTEAIDAARFDYIYDGALWSLGGLLVEPQRTNLLTSSAVATAAAAMSLSANAVTDPAGGSTADRGLETTANGAHSLNNSTVSMTGPARVCMTAYIQPIGRSAFSLNTQLTGGTRTALYDYSGDAFSSVSSGLTCFSELAATWRRIGCANDAGTGSRTLSMPILVNNPLGTLSFVGDVTKGYAYAFAQAEVGEFPTSYIPTSGSSATRSADVLTLDLDDGDWNLEVVTPNGTFTTPSPVTSSGGYVFDWADLTGAATERHVLSITATGA